MLRELNAILIDWSQTPDGNPWVASKKGQGARLNMTIHWSVDRRSCQMLRGGRSSVRTRTTDHKTMERNQPGRGKKNKLPARSRHDTHREDDDDWQDTHY
jgi:hypothetical protein